MNTTFVNQIKIHTVHYCRAPLQWYYLQSQPSIWSIHYLSFPVGIKDYLRTAVHGMLSWQRPLQSLG